MGNKNENHQLFKDTRGAGRRSIDSMKPRLTTKSNHQLKFRKGKIIGKGAFGSVFQAMNVMSGELLAIKQIPIPDNAPNIISAVEREIHINSHLPPHPHCVQYIGMQRTNRNIYILMEYVSGGSVQSLLQSVGRFHEATMQRYAHSVLLGLRHLHGHNVIHQDIKGANVLIDERGVAKIADFGCSREVSNTSGITCRSIHNGGTPLWMAPEVCRGNSPSNKSDIWSFGCLLLEMTNEDHAPWVFSKDTSVLAVLYAIGAATKPPSIPTHLSKVATDFIDRCLQIDPMKRATTEELLKHPFITSMEKGCKNLDDHAAENWTHFDDESASDTDSDWGLSSIGKFSDLNNPSIRLEGRSPNMHGKRDFNINSSAANKSSTFILNAVEKEEEEDLDSEALKVFWNLQQNQITNSLIDTDELMGSLSQSSWSDSDDDFLLPPPCSHGQPGDTAKKCCCLFAMEDVGHHTCVI